MSTLMQAALRRNWRLVGAIAAFLVFTLIHFTLFRPAAERYRSALSRVGGIEAVFSSGGAHPMLPPHLFALITEHSLTPQDATDRGGSGALGVLLLEDLGRQASRTGLAIVASDPGAVAQQPQSLQVRAHVIFRGRYAQLVDFFDELARSDSLTLVDRFKITPLSESTDEMELWVSRLYLKRAATP